MARVWRDGQTKPCFIYRMLAVSLFFRLIFFKNDFHASNFKTRILSQSHCPFPDWNDRREDISAANTQKSAFKQNCRQ